MQINKRPWPKQSLTHTSRLEKNSKVIFHLAVSIIQCIWNFYLSWIYIKKPNNDPGSAFSAHAASINHLAKGQRLETKLDDLCWSSHWLLSKIIHILSLFYFFIFIFPRINQHHLISLLSPLNRAGAKTKAFVEGNSVKATSVSVFQCRHCTSVCLIRRCWTTCCTICSSKLKHLEALVAALKFHKSAPSSIFMY